MSLIVFIVICMCWWLWKSYNRIIPAIEQCNNSFSNIDTELARRFDLYIKATDVMENGTDFEQKIYTKITSLRTRTDLSNSEKINNVDRLLAVAENNPDVKSISLFSNMQTAINLTESRVQEARQRYNDDVKKYNILISQIPMNLAARMLKFVPREYFQYTS